jgi:hypothetical protein
MTTSIDNLFARDGFWWWVGVVEDRMDPLKLGRVRVRITGYHTDNKNELPTNALPWSMPMQPILSAAISGKGNTPLGPLEGTWVVGFFADGAECQQPIIMGTIGGIPNTSNACVAQARAESNAINSQRDVSNRIVLNPNGVALPENPQPVDSTATSSNSISSTLPSLNQQEIQAYMDAIAFRESSSTGTTQNYATQTTGSGFVGKYQLGAEALQTTGYLKNPVPVRRLTNEELADSRNWTGKNGVFSLEEFKQNKNNVQEKAMYDVTASNYSILRSKGIIDTQMSADQVAGYLGSAHLLGWTGARDLKNGVNGHDGNGTKASTWWEVGARAINASAALPAGTNTASGGIKSNKNIFDNITDWAGALNNPKLGQPDAFNDPNSVYPKCDYTARADTNKLATNNDSLQTTLLKEKDSNRSKGIPTANGASSGTWDEPASAFNAKYPYNHVKETESGHVIELDDTPNAERIHIYHRTGTYVEIDREGSVSYKVKGENYEIYNRNNRMYVMGNHDITVDGAKTLLVKNALDVEVLGKTTINIKNDADLNVSGTFNIKAQNINIEAQQDLNIKTGNYFNNSVGGDLNYTVTGDEQHRVFGDLDMDASDINLNSGTANPFAATATLLDDGVLSDIYGSTTSAFEETGLNPLPDEIASPQNAIGKGLSSIFGNSGGSGGGGSGILGFLGKLPSAAGENSLGGGAALLGGAGFVASGTGSGFGNIFGSGGSLGDLLPGNLIDQGRSLIQSFTNGNITNIDKSIPNQILGSRSVFNEFTSWTDIPAVTQLSKHFNVGDLSSRVKEVGLQSFLSPQGNLGMDEIATNLKSLAVNTLDPLRDRYPNMEISDAFRPVASQLLDSDPDSPLSKMFSGISNQLGSTALDAVQQQLNTATPFNLGQAANVQFKGAQASEYFGIAQWAKDNVPYDQMRLEYSTIGSGQPWITLIHKQEGNRDVAAEDKIVTTVNGEVVANYLVDMTQA